MRVSLPVNSEISKRFSGHTSQDVCPWNEKFARPLVEPSFAPRAMVASNDARTIARSVLQLTQEEFSAAFKDSPIKRTKLRGLKRSAAVVLGNVGDATDLAILSRAQSDEEPLVREHAAWGIAEIQRRARERGSTK